MSSGYIFEALYCTFAELKWIKWWYSCQNTVIWVKLSSTKILVQLRSKAKYGPNSNCRTFQAVFSLFAGRGKCGGDRWTFMLRFYSIKRPNMLIMPKKSIWSQAGVLFFFRAKFYGVPVTATQTHTIHINSLGTPANTVKTCQRYRTVYNILIARLKTNFYGVFAVDFHFSISGGVASNIQSCRKLVCG